MSSWEHLNLIIALRRNVRLVSEVFQGFGPAVCVKDAQELELYPWHISNSLCSSASVGLAPLVSLLACVESSVSLPPSSTPSLPLYYAHLDQ